MGVLFTNNGTTTLASSITDVATTLNVAPGTGSFFPAPTGGDWFPLTVVDGAGNMEVMKCTARATDALTVARGQEGTTALAFAAGARVDLRATAASFAAKQDASVNLTTIAAGAESASNYVGIFGAAADLAAAIPSANLDQVLVAGQAYERITPNYWDLGPERITNGDMSSASGWTVGANWSIATGVATHTAGATNSISQNIGETGASYLVSIDVTAYTAGYFYTRVGVSGVASPQRTAVGSYWLVQTQAGADNVFRVNPSSDFVGSVDNCSVKKLPANAIKDAAGTWWGPMALAPLGPDAVADSRYLAEADGAIVRSLRSRLGDVKSVRDFGPTAGNGVAADDTAALLLAAAWVSGGSNRFLVNPAGCPLLINQEVVFDFAHRSSVGGFVSHSPITPDASLARAIQFIDGRDAVISLFIMDGGAIADYTQADPTGGTEAIYVRGLRDAYISIGARSYLGRVLRCAIEEVGEFKTSKITFPYFHTDALSTSIRTGQSVYVDCSSAFGSFVDAQWFYDVYGPIFYETHDVNISHVDGGLWSTTGIDVVGCFSFWAPVVSLGDGDTPFLFKWRNGATVNGGNSHIGAIFVQLVEKGIHVIGAGVSTTVPGLSFGVIKSNSCTEHALYLDTCRALYIERLESTGDKVALETTGTCSNLVFGSFDILNSKRQAVIIGASSSDVLVKGGRVHGGSAESSGTYPVIAVNSTGANIVFRDLTLYATIATFLYDLVASNDVHLLGGKVSVGGSTVIMGTNKPKRAREVLGYPTQTLVNVTFDIGESSKVFNHGLAYQISQAIPMPYNNSGALTFYWDAPTATTARLWRSGSTAAALTVPVQCFNTVHFGV